MRKNAPPQGNYECIEPELGLLAWRRDDPSAPADLRARLERHLVFCDACRLAPAIERRVAQGLRDGSIRIPASGYPPARMRSPRRAVAAAGACAFAAGLAAMLLLPPAPAGPRKATRAAPAVMRIVRPVEGEVVLGRTPKLRWTAAAGASAYRVDISAVGDDYSWSAQTTATRVQVPDDAPCPPAGVLRAVLEPIPPDLAPAGGVSVSFRVGTVAQFARQRLTASPGGARAVALLGLAALAAAVTMRRRRTAGTGAS